MDTSTTHPGQIEDRRFWRKLRRAAGHFPLTAELVAGYYAMRDKETPWRHKLILAGAIAYFILPVDAVPDFILPMGYADDAAALLAALGAVRMSVREEHRTRARRTLGLIHQGEGVVPGDVVTEQTA